MESSLWCGLVTRYAPGNATQSGEIVIGSKRWLIGTGIAYESAGPNPPDHTTRGAPTCLTAAIDDAGRIQRYLTSDMPAIEGGLVTSYTPPTATQIGTLVFSYKYVRTVAAGAQLDDVELGRHVCVKQALDLAGDRVITATMTCQPVQVN